MKAFLLPLVLFCIPSIGSAQLPLDTELLVDGSFEAPTLSGWNTQGTMTLKPYGAANNPSLFVGMAIGGASQLVGDFSGGSSAWQSFDYK